MSGGFDLPKAISNVVVVEALVGAFIVLHRRIDGSGSGGDDPILLEITIVVVIVVADLFFSN